MRKSGRKSEYNKFKFLVNHLAPNSEYEVKISALNRKGTGRPVSLTATTKKKPDRLFITKITDQTAGGLDGDYVLKNDLTGLHWLSNQQIVSIPATYVLSMVSICLGILIFILIIRKKYKRLIVMQMHSALRANQLNSFASSSNPISKCLFAYHKKPELTNEHFDHEHTLMGCCNVDYREDNLSNNLILARTGRQLTTFGGLSGDVENLNGTLSTLNSTLGSNLNSALNGNLSSNLNGNLNGNLNNLNSSNLSNNLNGNLNGNRNCGTLSANLQLQSSVDQQRFCELNTSSVHFNAYGQLTNSRTASNLASASTRDLFDAACLYANTLSVNTLNGNNVTRNPLGATVNSLGNLPANLPRSSLAALSNQRSDSPAPPLTPPPSYEASTSMLALTNLPAPPASLLSNASQAKIYESHLLTNSLLHHHHSINQASFVDYTNRYQSLNRKVHVHPKLEEFKKNNLVNSQLVVNLDSACKGGCKASDTTFNSFGSFSSKSLDRKGLRECVLKESNSRENSSRESSLREENSREENSREHSLIENSLIEELKEGLRETAIGGDLRADDDFKEKNDLDNDLMDSLRGVLEEIVKGPSKVLSDCADDDPDLRRDLRDSKDSAETQDDLNQNDRKEIREKVDLDNSQSTPSVANGSEPRVVARAEVQSGARRSPNC